MEEEKLERALSITKKGFPAIWVYTQRYATPNIRYGQSTAVCTPNGEMTKIMRTIQNYTQVKRLVRISSKCVIIQATYNIDGSTVLIYKVDSIDTQNKKVILHKVAKLENDKWDNTSYVRNYKKGVHSTLMRAKKIYCLHDLD